MPSLTCRKCRQNEKPTHFAHSIDMLDAAGEIQEHLAGVEDYLLAEAVWLARTPSPGRMKAPASTEAFKGGQ
jgi:hypothetical protein